MQVGRAPLIRVIGVASLFWRRYLQVMTSRTQAHGRTKLSWRSLKSAFL